jgi:hypothetical protein
MVLELIFLYIYTHLTITYGSVKRFEFSSANVRTYRLTTILKH